MRAKTNEKTIQVTTTLTMKDYEAIKKLAAKNNKAVAEIMREHILRGMSIEKSKDDVDFIRKHIREEAEAVMEKYMNRIIKLQIKTGIPAIAMCHFTSDLLFHFMKDHSDIKKDEILESGKKKAAAYLRIRSEFVNEAFEQQLIDDDY